MKRFLLCSPDGGEGGSTAAEPAVPEAPSSPPPAATTVTQSDAQESDASELVELRRQLAEEKAGRKKDQTRLSELEDENHQLKKVPVPTTKPNAAEKRSFLDGATFFG